MTQKYFSLLKRNMLDQSSAYWNIYDSTSYSLTHFDDVYKIISGINLDYVLNSAFPKQNLYFLFCIPFEHASLYHLTSLFPVQSVIWWFWTALILCTHQVRCAPHSLAWSNNGIKKNLAELSEIAVSFSSQQVHISFILSVHKLL